MKSAMKVGTGLGLGFAWVVLLLVLVTGFGVFNMHQVQGRFTHVVEVKNPESSLVKDMLETVGERSISLRNLMLPAAPEDVDIEAQYIEAQSLKYKMAAQKLQQLCTVSADTTEEEKAALSEDVKEVYAEAKGNGFDTKTLRAIVRLRKMDSSERAEQEALQNLYLGALGMRAIGDAT